MTQGVVSRCTYFWCRTQRCANAHLCVFSYLSCCTV